MCLLDSPVFSGVKMESVGGVAGPSGAGCGLNHDLERRPGVHEMLRACTTRSGDSWALRLVDGRETLGFSCSWMTRNF